MKFFKFKDKRELKAWLNTHSSQAISPVQTNPKQGIYGYKNKFYFTTEKETLEIKADSQLEQELIEEYLFQQWTLRPKAYILPTHRKKIILNTKGE